MYETRAERVEMIDALDSSQNESTVAFEQFMISRHKEQSLAVEQESKSLT